MLHATSDSKLATLTVETDASPLLVYVHGELRPFRKANELYGSTKCTEKQTDAIQKAIPFAKAYIKAASRCV